MIGEMMRMNRMQPYFIINYTIKYRIGKEIGEVNEI